MPTNINAELAVVGVSHTFGQLAVIDQLSLTVAKGEFVSIVGPSGSGKSTLFNIIAGLLQPTEGTIYRQGRPVTGQKGQISYMYQKDLLMPWKTVIDNVALPLRLKGKQPVEARQLAAEHFKLFGLEGFEKKYPHQLSGGMRQRAALLRTYLFSKDILLLDEPFGGLDAMTRTTLQFWLLSVLGQSQPTILFVTHDIEEAVLLSDRVIVLSKRPASIVEQLVIDLPRPRIKAMVTGRLFNQYKELIQKMLQA